MVLSKIQNTRISYEYPYSTVAPGRQRNVWPKTIIVWTVITVCKRTLIFEVVLWSDYFQFEDNKLPTRIGCITILQYYALLSVQAELGAALRTAKILAQEGPPISEDEAFEKAENIAELLKTSADAFGSGAVLFQDLSPEQCVSRCFGYWSQTQPPHLEHCRFRQSQLHL